MLEGQLDALERDIAAARQAATPPPLIEHRRDEPPPPPRGEPVRLPGGATILIRAVAPEDAGQLLAGFQQLGAVSRYRRFLEPIDRLSPRQVAEATRVDHVHDEALAAIDAATGEGVGVAQYTRDAPGQAEFHVAVIDAWQGRGVGSALFERLTARAREAGVQVLVGRTIVGDAASRRLLAHCADIVGEERDGGTVVLTARLR